ncbi:MAG: hypothetical protein EZS28_029340, partial [Streblomastix strix]
VAFEPNTDAKNELQLFKILQPSNARKIPYSKIIDYRMNISQEDEKEIYILSIKQLKAGQQDANTPTIGSEIHTADFRGIVSRIYTVSNTKQVGGIAVVSSNEIIPKMLSYNSMINLKGIVFVIPEFALYMNGKLLWKRNSSSTSVNQLPVLTVLCHQLDMECNEKTAKFFLDEKLNEEIEIGVSKLPPDIQVVVLATGFVRVYKSHNTEQKGQKITKLIEWIDLSKQDKDRFGFIAEGDEILNNIPIPEKNFRAITYDEKDGIIRLGWHEVFRWIPTLEGLKIIFEVDLREDIQSNTIRIFCEFEECPIIFVNVPKRLKLYV